MARAKSPVASASAKPRNAKGCTCACEAGLRATELISAEKTLPMPTPAPTSAMQARPAPIILAEARSIVRVPSLKSDSVQVEGVAQIEASQDRKDIGLQYGDEQFEADQRDAGKTCADHFGGSNIHREGSFFEERLSAGGGRRADKGKSGSQRHRPAIRRRAVRGRPARC